MSLSGNSALSGNSGLQPVAGPSYLFLDTFDGVAGDAAGRAANTGEIRVTPTGTVLLTGTGSAYLDENSNNYTILKYTGAPAMSASNTLLVTMSAYQGDSEMFVFNTDFTGAGTGWGIYINDDDDLIYLVRLNGIMPLDQVNLNYTLHIEAGVAPQEPIEVAITFSPNGDSITLTCKGSSATFTESNRQYKSQTGYGFFMQAYDLRDKIYNLAML